MRFSVVFGICRYTKVFQYLLRLKRIQLELEKSWAQAMQQDRADTAEQRRDSRQQRMPMWRVRQHMTYLITNLQFYIQVPFLPKRLCTLPSNHLNLQVPEGQE